MKNPDVELARRYGREPACWCVWARGEVGQCPAHPAGPPAELRPAIAYRMRRDYDDLLLALRGRPSRP